jgi:hypothetical protein
MKIFFYHICGAIATILSIIALLYKNKQKLLKIQLLSNLLYSLQYAIMNAMSASYVTLIAIFRSIFFKNENKKILKISILTLTAIIVGFFSYTGTLLSLLPILCSIICIFGASIKNVRYYKLVYGFCSAIWIYYNFKVGAYIIILANICEIISAIIGYFRYENNFNE